MPGAQPSANPAQREEFEQRCRDLSRESYLEEMEAQASRAVARATAGHGAAASDLEAMFPNIDADLIRAIHTESPTPQHAIETLLALSAAIAEPVGGSEEAASRRATSPPPLLLGVEDYDKFPCLTDGNGWQAVSQRQLERDDEDLGSAWCDRAKVAARLPQPPLPVPVDSRAWGAARQEAFPSRRAPSGSKGDDECFAPEVETEYEMRQRLGQRRIQHRVQYGRGAGGGRGSPAVEWRPSGPEGRGAGGICHGAESESEESSVDIEG